MKTIFKKIIIIVAMTSLIFVITGCENEGSAEKAGKKVDQTLDSIKKKIDDAKK
jgi:TATA-box binding protein (TBP) (component of TFIID and TFIIIB)